MATCCRGRRWQQMTSGLKPLRSARSVKGGSGPSRGGVRQVLDLARRPAYARCGHLLPRVDSAYLDCVSDTLALLLAARGVADVLTPFACDWRFDLTGL